MRVSFLDLEFEGSFCYLCGKWIVFKTGGRDQNNETIAILWGKMSRAIYNGDEEEGSDSRVIKEA